MKVAALVLALEMVPCVAAANADTLAADFAGHFVCDQQVAPEMETFVERFLEAQGFRVLNLGRVQRSYGVFLIRTRLFGIDPQDRMIEVLSLDSSPGRYALTLRTAPPTVHSASLEAMVESFPSQIPTCSLVQSHRGSNDSDALAFFESEVRRVKELYRQAEALTKAK